MRFKADMPIIIQHMKDNLRKKSDNNSTHLLSGKQFVTKTMVLYKGDTLYKYR